MPSALSFPDQTRRLRLEVAAQPNRLDEACRATGQRHAFFPFLPIATAFFLALYSLCSATA